MRVHARDDLDKHYADALADPNHVELDDGMIMRPFHTPTWQGQEWHLYCPRHPRFGYCGFEDYVREEAHQHVHYKHGSARSSEGSADE